MSARDMARVLDAGHVRKRGSACSAASAGPELLSLIQALAYGVYARDAAQYDDRIRAFRLK